VQPERRSVLVTHADEPLGRRLVKHLYFDESVGHIVAVGGGPPPRSLARFLADEKAVDYVEVDLTRHRQVADLFHGGAVRSGQVDTIVFVPPHAPADPDGRPRLSGVPDRTTEARLVLQHCLETASVRQLVALGSAFVYRLTPGNANRFDERSALDFDPDLPAVTRSWIDCDMLLHAEVHNERLAVALLRVPTVVGADGGLFLHPALSSPSEPLWRAAGFDPMCALVADQDVCRAVVLALHRRAAGTFNIAGRESVPLSVLARWAGSSSRPVPGPLLRSAAGAARILGVEAWRTRLDGPHVRYGFTLDTRRAEETLGFRPQYRIGPGRSEGGRPRIDAHHA
jgi:nucleoside-diphosphate-sugar epimerase